MRALFLGPTHPSSTARHRADALARLGCEVDMHDPFEAVHVSLQGLPGAIHYRTGYMFLNRAVERWVRTVLSGAQHYDLCMIDGGELLSAVALKSIKAHCQHLVLFNHDDPTGPRDGARFMTLRRAIPAYDLCLVVRPVNVDEFKARGAKEVRHVWRSYDEIAHRPLDPTRPVDPIYDNDIAFIGRRIKGEDRDLFLRDLIKLGIKPAIWGDNWQSSPVWSTLQPYWRGASLSGQNYVDAMRGAKMCLGMLSKGNRDEHTTRSMEIPAAGGLLFAERTTEHEQLYREGEEAVFWSTTEECATRCKALLADSAFRESVRQGGQRRVLINKVGNEDLCKIALNHFCLT